MISASPCLIAGVNIQRLTAHLDTRGCFTEIFRESWLPSARFVQWNAVHSRAGTLRGVHVHRKHADYLVLLAGRMWLGLADLRHHPRSDIARTVIEITGSQPVSVAIPPLVAHGFLFAEDSVHVYAVSEYFNPADELGCRWNDSALGLEWPMTPTQLSARDQDLPSLGVLLATL